MLVQEAPFPGNLAGQGRHDSARLVMQQLLQVREQRVQNRTYTPVGLLPPGQRRLLLFPWGTQMAASGLKSLLSNMWWLGCSGGCPGGSH